MMLALKAIQGQGMFWYLASPDMNPCDFFLWGLMNELVYKQAGQHGGAHAKDHAGVPLHLRGD